MADDFDELVARGEDRAAGEPTEEERAERAFEAMSRRRCDLAQRSLGDPGPVTPFVLVALMLAGIGGLVGVVGALQLQGLALQVVAIGFIVVWPTGLWLGSRAFFRWWASREIAALHALAFPLEVGRYVRQLGNERGTTEPRVVLWFAAELDEADRTRVASAAAGAPGVTRREWRTDGALLVVGPRVQTHWAKSDDPKPATYNNRLAHRWVRRILRRGVAPIHSRHPLARVRVMLSS